MPSKCLQNASKMLPQYLQDAAKLPSNCIQNAFKMLSVQVPKSVHQDFSQVSAQVPSQIPRYASKLPSTFPQNAFKMPSKCFQHTFKMPSAQVPKSAFQDFSQVSYLGTWRFRNSVRCESMYLARYLGTLKIRSRCFQNAFKTTSNVSKVLSNVLSPGT